jgi:hypothetical protein
MLSGQKWGLAVLFFLDLRLHNIQGDMGKSLRNAHSLFHAHASWSSFQSSFPVGLKTREIKGNYKQRGIQNDIRHRTKRSRNM